MESSNAEAIFQQLDKLRTIYDAYMKLVEETIPLAEKNLNLHLADESQKTQTLDDVSSVINAIHFQFSHTTVCSRAKRTCAFFFLSLEHEGEDVGYFQSGCHCYCLFRFLIPFQTSLLDGHDLIGEGRKKLLVD